MSSAASWWSGGRLRSSPAEGCGVFEAEDTNGNGIVADQNGILDPGDTFRGEFQYKDHGGDVAFHGVLDGGCFVPANNPVALIGPFPSVSSIPGSGFFTGTYRPVPATLGDGGRFEVLVLDDVTSPFTQLDRIWIFVSSGVFAGYNTRPVGGLGRQVSAGSHDSSRRNDPSPRCRPGRHGAPMNVAAMASSRSAVGSRSFLRGPEGAVATAV